MPSTAPTALDPERSPPTSPSANAARELELLTESRRLAGEGDGAPAEGARRTCASTSSTPAAAPPRERLWRWAAMAAGLTALAAAGGWMWSWNETRSLADRIADEHRSAETAAERLAGLERQAEELGETAAQARDDIARLETELAGRVRATAPPRHRGPEMRLNTPVIDLFPGDVVVRGAGAAPRAPGRLPAGAGPVTLVLNLEAPPAIPRLRAAPARRHGARCGASAASARPRDRQLHHLAADRTAGRRRGDAGDLRRARARPSIAGYPVDRRLGGATGAARRTARSLPGARQHAGVDAAHPHRQLPRRPRRRRRRRGRRRSAGGRRRSGG